MIAFLLALIANIGFAFVGLLAYLATKFFIVLFYAFWAEAWKCVLQRTSEGQKAAILFAIILGIALALTLYRGW